MLANYNPREKIDDQQVFQHVVGTRRLDFSAARSWKRSAFPIEAL
jgi:hypothetical protein